MIFFMVILGTMHFSSNLSFIIFVKAILFINPQKYLEFLCSLTNVVGDLFRLTVEF